MYYKLYIDSFFILQMTGNLYLLSLAEKSGIFKDFSSMELLISADLLMPPIVRSGVVPACRLS